jgi:serine/threonine protein phosphatase PrpC
MTALISFTAAAVSDAGQVRQNNEDAVYSGRWLFAVADGLGGHAAGELASAAAIEALQAYDRDIDPTEALKTLGRAIREANAEIARRAAENPVRRGMGTTLTAVLLTGDRLAVAHIGDSRAFRLRGGQLRQITEDHVMGNLVSNAGSLAEFIVRFLDGRPDRSPDLILRDLQPGDRYLLCSDGLSPVVADAAVLGVLAAAADPDAAVRELVALAEGEGAPDNVSVIVIDVREGDDGTGLPPVVLGSAAQALTR